jgi:hypothetical protein
MDGFSQFFMGFFARKMKLLINFFVWCTFNGFLLSLAFLGWKILYSSLGWMALLLERIFCIFRAFYFNWKEWMLQFFFNTSHRFPILLNFAKKVCYLLKFSRFFHQNFPRDLFFLEKLHSTDKFHHLHINKPHNSWFSARENFHQFF